MSWKIKSSLQTYLNSIFGDLTSLFLSSFIIARAFMLKSENSKTKHK